MPALHMKTGAALHGGWHLVRRAWIVPNVFSTASLRAGAAIGSLLTSHVAPLVASQSGQSLRSAENPTGAFDITTAVRLSAVRRIGETDGSVGFGKISHLVADPTGGVLAFDVAPEGKPLLRFTPEGVPLSGIGGFGDGPGEFGRGSSATITREGLVVVYDARRARLTVWGQDGQPLRTIAVRGLAGAGWVAHVRPGPPGSVFVGHLAVPTSLPPGTVAWTHLSSRYWLVNLTSGVVTPLPWQEPLPATTPVRPFGERSFRQPLVSGELIDVTSNELGFRVLGGDGGPRQVRLPFTRPSVSRAERLEQEQYAAYLRERLPPTHRPAVWETPAVKQAATDLKTDHKGRIWIRVATEGVAGRVRALASNSDGGTLEGRMQDRQVWVAFLPTGKYLGAVLFPDSIEDVVFSGGYAWGIERDDDDLQYLVQFKLPW